MRIVTKKHILFLLWFVGLSLPLTYMAASHTLIPKPSHALNLKELLPHSTSPSWNQLHFLGPDCLCSKNVYEALLKRGPHEDSNIKEKVVIFSHAHEWSEKLKAKGFEVIEADMDEFAKKYSINAIPQLTIFNPQNAIAYSGGYTSNRNPASFVEDEIILHETKENLNSKERPIFGCLSGNKNRKIIDPLNLKY